MDHIKIKRKYDQGENVSGNQENHMRNEQIHREFDELKKVFHLERRENRKDMEKLTNAITSLTVSITEAKEREKATFARVDELKETVLARIDNAEEKITSMETLINSLDKLVATIELRVSDNTQSRGSQRDFWLRILEKVVTWAILGALALKVSGTV